MSATTVLRGVSLIDGAGAAPIADATLVVTDGHIAAAGRSGAIPAGARVIEARGLTALPGFIDAHAHMLAYAFNLEQRLTTHATLVAFRSMRNLRMTLDAGVTTVRDAGGIDAGFRLALEEELVVGPRLLVSGQGLAPTGALFDFHWGSGAQVDLRDMVTGVRQYVNGVENVRLFTRQLLLSGVDVIKIVSTGSIFQRTGYPPRAQYTSAELDAIVSEAHAAGKKVMCHAEGGPGVTAALRAGVDSIEHGFYLEDSEIELMLKQGTYLVPTLSAAEAVIRQGAKDPNVHDWAVSNAKALLGDPRLGFGRALKAGVRIAMGSDIFGANHGDNLAELAAMVRHGMTPLQAIRAATCDAADLLDLGAEVGTLAAGKRADVVVVDGDPLADITILQDRARLRLIMRDGVIHKDTLASAA